MKSFPLLLLISAFFITASSCDKLQKDPEVKLAFSEIADDGVVMTATVSSGKKNVSMVGFCYGKTSMPVAEPSYSVGYTTTISSFSGNDFTSVIPHDHFESYTGYYIRPFVKTNSGKYIYGQEVYYDTIQRQPVTPTCMLSDNYFASGVSSPYTFSGVNVYYGSMDGYELNAFSYSTTDHLIFEFKRKPKTGIYKTSTYASDDNSMVHVIINVGSMSKNLESGYPIYVNEVAKDKFEITLCEVPWKFSSSTTLYLNSKIIAEQ